MRSRLIEQHVDVCTFLWFRRDAAARGPHHDLTTLADLDERIEAQLDGLRVAGDAGRATSAAALDDADPGTFFVAGVLAVEQPDADAIAVLVERVASDAALSRGLASALGWAPYDVVSKTVRGLLGAKTPAARRIGVAVSAMHRIDPGHALVKALSDSDARLRARALRAVGELGRADLRAAVEADLRSDEEACRFWAAWSGALLGVAAALPVLEGFAASDGPYAEPATMLLVRCIAPGDARALLERLAGDPARARTTAKAAGALGDPALMPRLLAWMENPELARVAAEAFTSITGEEIVRALCGPCPPGFSADELAEKDILHDPDIKLEWPAPAAVRVRWAVNEGRYRPGTRYLLGAAVTPERLREVLLIGKQAHRAGAALELALAAWGRPLFEVRAPASRQRALLLRFKGETGASQARGSQR